MGLPYSQRSVISKIRQTFAEHISKSGRCLVSSELYRVPMESATPRPGGWLSSKVPVGGCLHSTMSPVSVFGQVIDCSQRDRSVTTQAPPPIELINKTHQQLHFRERVDKTYIHCYYYRDYTARVSLSLEMFDMEKMLELHVTTDNL